MLTFLTKLFTGLILLGSLATIILADPAEVVLDLHTPKLGSTGEFLAVSIEAGGLQGWVTIRLEQDTPILEILRFEAPAQPINLSLPIGLPCLDPGTYELVASGLGRQTRQRLVLVRGQNCTIIRTPATSTKTKPANTPINMSHPPPMRNLTVISIASSENALSDHIDPIKTDVPAANYIYYLSALLGGATGIGLVASRRKMVKASPLPQKEIQAKIKEGHIHVRAVFEIIGHPKSHVESTLTQYIEHIAKDKDLRLLKVSEAVPEQKDKLWHTFADVEMLVYGVDKLGWLCFNFAPASIEVLEPSSLRFTDKDFTDWLNDLLARLHEISSHMQAINSSNTMLQKNINMLVRNGVLLAISTPKSTEEVGTLLGLPQDKILPFLDALVKEGKALKNQDRYERLTT